MGDPHDKDDPEDAGDIKPCNTDKVIWELIPF